MDLDRGQGSVAFGAELHPGRHLMARGGADELLLASELPFHRSAGLERREHAQILGDHLLLAAESAADALGEDVNVARAQTEQMAKLLLRDERRLRTGADMKPSVIASPGNRSVRLEVNVLNAGGGIGHLVHRIRGCEAIRYAADLAVDVDIDVPLLRPALVVQDGGIRRHGGDRIEDGGQDLVGDIKQPAGGLGGSLGLSDDRGDPLADEAHHVVENVGVVWIDQMVLVGRRAVEPAGNVLPGEDLDHARHRHGLVAADGKDARMRMRRAQHLEVQSASMATSIV